MVCDVICVVCSVWVCGWVVVGVLSKAEVTDLLGECANWGGHVVMESLSFGCEV